MPPESVLESAELLILLNILRLDGRKRVNLVYPLLRQPLLTLELADFTASGIVGKAEFERHQSEALKEKDVPLDEIPDFGDYKDCLLSSGCLRFENHTQLRSDLLSIRSESRSGPRLLRPLFLGLDTNAAYFRFFTRHLPMLLGEDGEVDDYNYVVSEVVRQEVGSRVRDKYSQRELHVLSRELGFANIWAQMSNKSKKYARKAKLALNELAQLRGPLRALEAQAHAYSKNKEERDRQIAESYAGFQERNQASVTLVTADMDMAYHARAARLGCVELRIPQEHPNHTQNEPWMLQHLLHDLAVTFGVVELKDAGVTLLGTWGGQGLEDTEQERVKLVLRNDNPVTKEFIHALTICRQITG